MVNVNKLKGKAVEKDIALKNLAEAAGITLSTFYRRMAGGGETFTVREVRQIAQRLGLNEAETNEIFFGIIVARDANIEG